MSDPGILGDLGITAGGAGSATSSLFGGIGDFQEASAYSTSAKYATQQAAYVALSTKIQQQQQQRQAYQVIGSQQAAEGGAGFSESGSASDLLKSSVQQASLQKNLITTQGLITQTGYEGQAAADKAQESAANAAGIGGLVGGALKLFGL